MLANLNTGSAAGNRVELATDFNGPVAMDSVTMTHDPGDNSWVWRTTAAIGNFSSPATVTYSVIATDADYDFLNDGDIGL